MKIYTGGIVGRYFEPDHVASIMALLPAIYEATGHRPIYKPRFNDALLCRARSRVAFEFLTTSDADVLLSVDSDIVFTTSDAISICQAAMEHDIVGGQYITRRKGGQYCFPTSLIADDRTVRYGESHELVPAKYISGGFIAVHRRVFQAMVDGPRMPLLHASTPAMTFYPFYQPFWIDGDNEKIYLSEDWAMCERARRLGFGCWIDPGVRLQHIGIHPYRLEDMLQPPLPVQEMWLTRKHGGEFSIVAPHLVPAGNGIAPG